MAHAMSHDGLLGELVPPAGRLSGSFGMRWRQSIEDSCAAGATQFTDAMTTHRSPAAAGAVLVPPARRCGWSQPGEY